MIILLLLCVNTLQGAAARLSEKGTSKSRPARWTLGSYSQKWGVDPFEEPREPTPPIDERTRNDLRLSFYPSLHPRAQFEDIQDKLSVLSNWFKIGKLSLRWFGFIREKTIPSTRDIFYHVKSLGERLLKLAASVEELSFQMRTRIAKLIEEITKLKKEKDLDVFFSAIDEKSSNL